MEAMGMSIPQYMKRFSAKRVVKGRVHRGVAAVGRPAGVKTRLIGPPGLRLRGIAGGRPVRADVGGAGLAKTLKRGNGETAKRMDALRGLERRGEEPDAA
jgi:hypothetical protein